MARLQLARRLLAPLFALLLGAWGADLVAQHVRVNGISVFGPGVDIGVNGVRLSGDGDGALTLLGLGDGSDEDLTLNLDDTANTAVFSSSTGLTAWDFGASLRLLLDDAACGATPPLAFSGDTDLGICRAASDILAFIDNNSIRMRVTGTGLEIGNADGVRLAGDGDGALTFLGQGNGSDEDLTLNLDDVANVVTLSSSTGVTTLQVPFIIAHTTRDPIVVDVATTFAVTSDYITLACTGPETINTITGGQTGMRLVIEQTDIDCTIADDDDPTAANAIDLTGVATNDVGAAKKTITLLYTSTDWLQVSESDN